MRDCSIRPRILERLTAACGLSTHERARLVGCGECAELASRLASFDRALWDVSEVLVSDCASIFRVAVSRTGTIVASKATLSLNRNAPSQVGDFLRMDSYRHA